MLCSELVYLLPVVANPESTGYLDRTFAEQLVKEVLSRLPRGLLQERHHTMDKIVEMNYLEGKCLKFEIPTDLELRLGRLIATSLRTTC